MSAPTRGIKINIAMATAFSRSEKRSSMTPPATAIGQAEATPTVEQHKQRSPNVQQSSHVKYQPKKRNAIKDPAFGA